MTSVSGGVKHLSHILFDSHLQHTIRPLTRCAGLVKDHTKAQELYKLASLTIARYLFWVPLFSDEITMETNRRGADARCNLCDSFLRNSYFGGGLCEHGVGITCSCECDACAAGCLDGAS
jgi:hypothetical protein